MEDLVPIDALGELVEETCQYVCGCDEPGTLMADPYLDGPGRRACRVPACQPVGAGGLRWT